MRWRTFIAAVIMALIFSLLYQCNNIIPNGHYEDPIFGFLLSIFFTSIWLGFKAEKWGSLWGIPLTITITPVIYFFVVHGPYYNIVLEQIIACLILGFLGGVIGSAIKSITGWIAKVRKRTKSGDSHPVEREN
ncbi:MAG: hypothetical protein M1269_13720 [Chloroflexi bacterium]|nr:hypothetical protein [Chloroflexota bacterium]